MPPEIGLQLQCQLQCALHVTLTSVGDHTQGLFYELPDACLQGEGVLRRGGGDEGRAMLI